MSCLIGGGGGGFGHGIFSLHLGVGHPVFAPIGRGGSCVL